jgi:uncharacterized protein
MLPAAPITELNIEEPVSWEGSPAVSETASSLLADVLAEVQAILMPVWPLSDFVAVNPFAGMADRHLLTARRFLRAVRDAELLMPLPYFRDMLQRGDLTAMHISQALDECRETLPQWYSPAIVEWISAQTRHGLPGAGYSSADRRYRTVAEMVDLQAGAAWNTAFIQEVARHCAAHFDEGQAAWGSPWKHLPLYQAWRRAAAFDRRVEAMGLSGFRRFASQLPEDPYDAVDHLLRRLEVPPRHWKEFLLCELYTVAGWSAYVKCRVRTSEIEGLPDDELVGLLAMRLAYDAALLEHMRKSHVECGPGLPDDDLCDHASPDRQSLLLYALQRAAETAFERRLCANLRVGANAPADDSSRKAVQMVFCIDVRSERMRRNLEAASSRIQTFGFAGFFGVPIEYVPLGAADGAAHCPVLLTPAVSIREGLRGADQKAQCSAAEARRSTRMARKLWKSFQASGASCFSFVESLGLAYAGRLLAGVGITGRDGNRRKVGAIGGGSLTSVGPIVHEESRCGMTVEQQVDFAHGFLRNLGLTDNFARIVAVCGHESETANNPCKASLDCGACGGHSGEANARVAAALLNDTEVRLRLSRRGVVIPNDCWFVPAVHNTTTDEIRYCDAETPPCSHVDEFHALREWSARATVLTRAERARKMGQKPAAAGDLLRRARDWSEVRPEWGLAGNAAFIVAPRTRTAGTDLDGRTFLHSYDFRRDPEFKTLELIMTAPMIVANWINLQYYASTVDNRAFGSGNKALHNVVGQFGILQGNGGDLTTGLPWQSIHDGRRLQHEPLRLLVVIEAPRGAVGAIIARHASVRSLVDNKWLNLLVIDGERFFRYSPSGDWRACRAVETC